MLITLCDRSKLRENLARVTVLEELEGCIESIVFSASETGFTVARFETTANEVITIDIGDRIPDTEISSRSSSTQNVCLKLWLGLKSTWVAA
jgi:hypothetical protein